MSDFFPEIEVTQHAAEAIARGLYAVAKVDGLHEREQSMIASFWSEVGGGAGALSELERAALISATELSAALSTPELRQLFLKTALLLAWADGKVSDPERKVVSEFAKSLGLANAELATLEASVKEFLLSHLATLNNHEAVVTVAKKLGI